MKKLQLLAQNIGEKQKMHADILIQNAKSSIVSVPDNELVNSLVGGEADAQKMMANAVNPGNVEQLAEVSTSLAEIGEVVALLHLAPLRLAGVGWESETQQAHLTSTTHGLFGLLKSLDAHFSSIPDGAVMSVSAMDGGHGNSSSRFNALAAGAHGIVKSYAKEKSPRNSPC